MLDDINAIYVVVAALLGSISSLIGAITTIKSFLSKTISGLVSDTVDEKISVAKDETEEKLDAKIDKVQSSIDSLSKDMNSFIEEVRKAQDLDRESIQAQARNIINEAHTTYYKNNGWIDEHTLYTLDQVANIYFKTGGNHFTEDQMKDIKNLPREKVEEPWHNNIIENLL